MNNSIYELSQDQRQTKNTKIISLQGATFYYPSHFHKKTEITYVVEGEVDASISGLPHHAAPDDLIFIPEFTTHSYSTTIDTKRYVLLPTTALFVDIVPLFKEKTLPFILSNREFNREKILPIMKELNEIRINTSLPTSYVELHLKGLINILFARLIECYQNLLQDKPQQIELVFKIHTYIEEHYQNQITLDEISKAFGYNKCYFSKLFNVLFGDSLNNYINNLRIKKFIEIVQKNKAQNENITFWAYHCGFNSMPSFYRAFQKLYNCSPNEYIKNTTS